MVEVTGEGVSDLKKPLMGSKTSSGGIPVAQPYGAMEEGQFPELPSLNGVTKADLLTALSILKGLINANNAWFWPTVPVSEDGRTLDKVEAEKRLDRARTIVALMIYNLNLGLEGSNDGRIDFWDLMDFWFSHRTHIYYNPIFFSESGGVIIYHEPSNFNMLCRMLGYCIDSGVPHKALRAAVSGARGVADAASGAAHAVIDVAEGAANFAKGAGSIVKDAAGDAASGAAHVAVDIVDSADSCCKEIDDCGKTCKKGCEDIVRACVTACSGLGTALSAVFSSGGNGYDGGAGDNATDYNATDPRFLQAIDSKDSGYFCEQALTNLKYEGFEIMAGVAFLLLLRGSWGHVVALYKYLHQGDGELHGFSRESLKQAIKPILFALIQMFAAVRIEATIGGCQTPITLLFALAFIASYTAPVSVNVKYKYPSTVDLAEQGRAGEDSSLIFVKDLLKFAKQENKNKRDKARVQNSCLIM